jgi:hypothetical protein
VQTAEVDDVVGAYRLDLEPVVVLGHAGHTGPRRDDARVGHRPMTRGAAAVVVGLDVVHDDEVDSAGSMTVRTRASSSSTNLPLTVSMSAVFSLPATMYAL